MCTSRRVYEQESRAASTHPSYTSMSAIPRESPPKPPNRPWGPRRAAAVCRMQAHMTTPPQAARAFPPPRVHAVAWRPPHPAASTGLGSVPVRWTKSGGGSGGSCHLRRSLPAGVPTSLCAMDRRMRRASEDTERVYARLFSAQCLLCSLSLSVSARQSVVVTAPPSI